MRYSKEQEKYFISQIRKILVMVSDASSREISEILAEQKKRPLKLSRKYVDKLKKKILEERTMRYNYYLVNSVLAAFEDKIREIDGRLWNLLNDPDTTPGEKVMVLREIRKNDESLMDKMFDAGVFSRKIGELEIGSKLSKEEQDLIKRVIKMDYGEKSKPEPNSEGSSVTGGENKTGQ